jgi:diketogulonate reductase-like aldo/keto reductase
MRRHRLGRTSAVLPVIGQGTWELERTGRRRAVEALRAGIDAGLTHIDTAEMYGNGEVEQIVGEAIAGRRDEVFLASKVLPENASYEGTLRACERTLGRLRVECLDLYLLHWRGTEPLEETFRAFERLHVRGDVARWGVSNFDVEDLEAAFAIAGEGRIACNQVLYHLLERTIEHRVAPWCAQHDIAIVAYSPFGSGDFPRARSTGRAVLERVAHRHGATARQVALSFLVRDGRVFAIPKAADPEHARENAGAGELDLSDADIAEIDAAFPRGRKRRLPML